MSKNETNTRSTQFEAHGQLLQAIRSEARRCANEGTSLAVIAVQLDRFDALAASAGEARAEGIFSELLRAVQIHCGRGDDRVFRAASDRIVAVCPKTLPAGAHHVATQIRDAADHLPAHADNSPITLSIGISIIAPGSEEGADHLLARAERSLGTASDNGGNRIIGAAPTSPPPAPTSLRTLIKTVIPSKRSSSARRQEN